MRVAAVESTTLATAGYGEAGELLQLEFRSGAVYPYFGVPPAVYGALLEAPSKDQYFHRAIRGRFAYRVVSDGKTAAPGVEPASHRR